MMNVSMKHEFGMMVWYWFGNCMVMGSSLGGLTLNFIFDIFLALAWIWKVEGNSSGMAK